MPTWNGFSTDSFRVAFFGFSDRPSTPAGSLDEDCQLLSRSSLISYLISCHFNTLISRSQSPKLPADLAFNGAVIAKIRLA